MHATRIVVEDSDHDVPIDDLLSIMTGLNTPACARSITRPIVALLLTGIVFTVAHAQSASEANRPTTPSERPGVAVFSGSIDATSVDAFIARHADDTLHRLIVTSGGGEIGAGMRLGNWVLDHGLDVEVVQVCASSCANYVFTAGRRKIIDDGAIVLWHGSALQKNFRRLLEDCVRQLHERERADGELAGGYADTRSVADPSCDYFAAKEREQVAFFARLGASEYITRLGQEPHDFEALWTVPVETMTLLGYRGVEAPTGYASAAYMTHFNVVEGPPVLSLRMLDDGSIEQLMR